MKRQASVWVLIVAAGFMVAQPTVGFSQTAKDNTEARQLFNKGVEFQINRNYADAERTFREALRKYPKAENSDRTAFYLIETLMKLRRVQEARAEAENFRRRYPSSRWQPDVTEVILELGGQAHISTDAGIWNSPAELREAQNIADKMLGLRTPVGPPNKIYGDDFPSYPSLDAEILRQIIQRDPEQGIEEARKLLKNNPSDPAVIANLGTIANSDSPRAIPFLLGLWGNTAATPSARDLAFFWFSRRHPDKAEVARAITDLLRKPETQPVASEALRRMTVADHRAVLEKIVTASNSDKFVIIDRIYRRGTSLLKADLLMFVGQLDDSRAVSLIVQAAQTDPDLSVRRAAVRALGGRKDVDTATLEALMRSAQPQPAPRAPQPTRFAPASGSAITGLSP